MKITLAGFLLICLFFLVSCDDFVLKNLLDGPEGARGPGDTVPLSISPSTITLTAGGSLTFTAVGGTPPYVFSVVSGLGSVNANTGLFVASISPGTAVVRVTDGEGGSSDATVTVSATGALAISPSTLSIAINNSITFLASGGVPPYTFSLTATGSGVPSVNAGTGLYTAGSLVGADQVQVEDSDAPPNTAVATINVTNIVTNVDYTILATNFPANATGGKAVSTGDFTIRNSGSAGGNQAVSWWVYISTDATLGSGDTLLCAGTTAALPSTGTVVIPLSGTWPLAAGIYRLFVTVDAADDLDPDTNGPTPITITAPDIDYEVTVVNNTGGTTTGGPIAGNYTVANSGADNGGQTVYWTAYVSLDDTPDGGDMVFATGTTGAIAGGGSTAGIPFSGTWPATAGNYYLVVKVSAGDDINALNDYGDSGLITVSDPPAPNVDYDVTIVNNTGGTTAAGPIAGNFTVHNNGTDTGSQIIHWTAFVSTDVTLDAGDMVFDSDTTGAIVGGGSTAGIPFSGTWPSAAGDYYLIVKVSAGDDINALNDYDASGLITISGTPGAVVDYRVTAVNNTGSTTTQSGVISGDFDVQNLGPDNGTSDVAWKVFRSTNATLDAGDALLYTGTTAALNSGAFRNVGFTGTAQWPSTAGTYYLIVEVIAANDSNGGNDTGNVSVVLAYQNGGSFPESEPNGDITFPFGDADNTGFVLAPGVQYTITGQVNGGSGDDDMFRFNTGTAVNVKITVTWVGGDLFDLYIYENVNGYFVGVSTSTVAGSETKDWFIDMAGVNRYLNINKWGVGDNGLVYTVIIQAH